MNRLLPALSALLCLSLSATGQQAPPDTTTSACAPTDAPGERDNLVHPPGTRTVPLGSLGRLELIGHGERQVVLFPGFAMAADVLRPLAEANRERWTALLVTPAGFADTPAAPMPDAGVRYRERSWCRATEQAVWETLQQLAWERPVLIGHIDGVHHAVNLAVAHPDEVRAVVSLAGELVRDYGDGVTPEQRAEQIDERLARQWFRTVDDATWEEGLCDGDWYSSDPERAREWFAASLVAPIPNQVRYLVEKWSQDGRQAFVDSGVPALALLADPTANPDSQNYEAFVGTVLNAPWRGIESDPTVQVDVLEGARLGLVQEQVERVSREIARFMEGLDP